MSRIRNTVLKFEAKRVRNGLKKRKLFFFNVMQIFIFKLLWWYLSLLLWVISVLLDPDPHSAEQNE
jgi:hypothetical protein